MQERSFLILAVLAAIAWFLFSLLNDEAPNPLSRVARDSGSPTSVFNGNKPYPQSPEGSGDPASSGQSGDASLGGHGFDFYVLSLSWSPSYCATEGRRADRQQCSSSRPYAFVAHGLWPQNESGYPQDCPTDNPYVPRGLVSQMRDIMPSAGLMGHEWRKHGSCSGLSQTDYFSAVRRAYEAITIPASFRNATANRDVDPMLVEKAFIAANPGIPAGGIAVTCKDGHLEDVRICMTKDLEFRSCGEVDANACRRRSVAMPPVR
ncbi:ribonuclease T2 family protein [Brucella sp. IR073]|uniref:ribonuclease T2 family protein n=1 Tax=unclassified Brucella TaxID=2632610 RepID=UPI003B97F6DB